MKHKLYKRLIYKVCVTLRVEKPEDEPTRFEYISYNCPWIDLKDNSMSLSEVITDYVEDLHYQRFGLDNIYTIDILKGDNLIQLINCNNRIITPEEIKEIEEKMKQEEEG